MNDRDAFALWIAVSMLRANEEDFAAEALISLGDRAKTSADLDSALTAAASGTRRPGDFGVEFIGAVLPVILVEFGRMLWDAYARSLADQGGKALATATLESLKELVRHTWSQKSGSISLRDAEDRLREAALRSGLDQAQIQKLVSSLSRPAMANELAAK